MFCILFFFFGLSLLEFEPETIFLLMSYLFKRLNSLSYELDMMDILYFTLNHFYSFLLFFSFTFPIYFLFHFP